VEFIEVVNSSLNESRLKCFFNDDGQEGDEMS